ncbi:hypothetical protein [Candidatus Terasakiella magnetica]|uniref:hypothetical protein n=1 Tax=Candidatus Terasakiella magnetica TaxID=1867952 RepID=UPI00196A136B|nr:hypothetical protein [Candidatus Terasakiella magnetica]
MSEQQIHLGDALADMHNLSHEQSAIPLIVQLVENPRFRLPGLELFHGAVDLTDHDCIHILLGRGMMPKDEAFVIGFTMGSTGKVGCFEKKLYQLISRHIYPDVYRFKRDDLEIFKDALHLGILCHCKALDRVDYKKYMDQPLGKVRKKLGLDPSLLKAYYAQEKKRYPTLRECRRLLN